MSRCARIFFDESASAQDTLLHARMVIVEGLNLEAVAAGYYTWICLPIEIAGADGVPARAVLISGSLFEEEK